MKIELKNNLGTVYTSTQDVETTNLVMSLQPPTPIKLSDFEPKLCKNCKQWKRNEQTKFGLCDSERFEINDDLLDISLEGNELLYWDYEGYGSNFVTGQDFGCIHFEGKE